MLERSGRLVEAAVAAGLIDARAVRPEGWLRGQRCPAGCDLHRRRGACNYTADGHRFHCHRCGTAGGFDAWLEARGESADRYLDAAPVRSRPPRGGLIAVDLGWAALQACPGRWRDAVAEWATAVRGWPADLSSAVVGRGGTPPLDDVAAFCTGALPRPALALVERARRLDRRLLLATRDVEGVVRSVRFRYLRAGGPGEKALALPQWATGPSAAWGGLSLFGRLESAMAAARAGQPTLLVEGGPDYLVAAGLVRLGVAGAALGVPSCATLPRLAAALRARLEAEGLRGQVALVPHRGDVGGAGVRAMNAARQALGPNVETWWVPVPVNGEGAGDLADAAAWVKSARVLSALVLAGQVRRRQRRAPPADQPSASQRAACRA